LLQKLKFIRNPDNWQLDFHYTIVRIFKEDYFTIVSQKESGVISELSHMPEPRLTDPPHTSRVNIKIRARVFRERVRKLYDFSCSVCGRIRYTRSEKPEVEASHIYPRRNNGSNEERNGIALCKLHHWAFDNGLFSIKDDYSIIIEERIRDKEDYEEITCFENEKIRLPENKDLPPHPIFLREHRKIHGFE
jgi:putative restriction endonuclease